MKTLRLVIFLLLLPIFVYGQERFAAGVDIDGKTVAVTTLATHVPIYLPLWISFVVTEAAGVLTDPWVSIGTNGPTCNNILASTPVGAYASQQYRNVFLTATQKSLTPNDATVCLRVNTVATGSLYLFNANVVGTDVY